MNTFRFLFFVTVLILGLTASTIASGAVQQPVPPAIPGPGEVLAAINNYRTQNGLPALTTIGLLSSLAQGQADYQASIGSVTHTGPGGTTPQQRAASAGYGGGGFFYYSEIIYGGWNAATSDAMAWWKNSGLHNGIMLDTDYTEIGAGVATDGTTVYFTAVLGGPTGGSNNSGSSGSSGEGSGSESPPATQGALPAVPVVKATPGPDGAITHIVRQGQTLWTIAAIYEIELAKLYELNEMNQYSFVFPGDELLIQPPLDPAMLAATQAADQTSGSGKAAPKQSIGTPFSSVKEQPKATQTPFPTRTPAPTPTPTEPPQASGGILGGDPMVTNLLIVALLILAAVMIASSFMQQKPSRPEKDKLLE